MAEPSRSVVQAFGLDPVEQPIRLEGGQGNSWKVGDGVLKPLDGGEEESKLVLEIQERLFNQHHTEYRVLEPLVRSQEAGTARYIVEGWTGTRFVQGVHALVEHWFQALEASRAFHTDLKELVTVEPEIFKSRTSPWAIADWIAWSEDELILDGPSGQQHLLPSFVGLCGRLAALKRPLQSNSYTNQLAHLDLMGNILLIEGHPPIIIDLSLYWRPVAYAEAIFVVDCMTGPGAPDDLVSSTGPLNATRFQMLVRAMIFRVLAWSIIALDRGEEDDPIMAGKFHRACDTIERVFQSKWGA